MTLRPLGLLLGLLLSLTIAIGAQSGGLKSINKGREGLPFSALDYLSRGQTTIVEFASRSCPNCRNLESALSQLQAVNPKLALRRVEIDRPQSQGIDWQSPLVRQYNLTSVPHFQIYDATGKLIADGEPARKMVIRYLLEAQVL